MMIQSPPAEESAPPHKSGLGASPTAPASPRNASNTNNAKKKKASFREAGAPPPLQAADKVSSPRKIASRSRLCRAGKRAIFVPFRQAAWRLGRRELRRAGFVIILNGGSAPRKGRAAP